MDIESGDTIVFTNFAWTYPLEHVLWKHSGKLCEIMMASSSVPAIFQPRKLETFQLVDGGVTNNLPVDLLAAADEKESSPLIWAMIIKSRQIILFLKYPACVLHHEQRSEGLPVAKRAAAAEANSSG